MAGDYRVYDARGKSLTGKDSVDRETARRIFSEERQRTRGSGSKPTLIRKGQGKELGS